MSTLRVDTITDEAGTGAPNFPNGATGLPDPFASTTVSGTTPSLDLSSFNYFEQGALTGDTTLIFASAPTSARFTYTYEPTLNTADAKDITTAVQNFSSAALPNNTSIVFFSEDGLNFIHTGSDTNVKSRVLSRPFDITSSVGQEKLYNAPRVLQGGGGFSSDGTKMYFTVSANTVVQYTMTTPYDVSTVSSEVLYDTSVQTVSLTYGVGFSQDGTKMYVSSDSNDAVYQYTLSTAWDISTASYASKSLSVVAQTSRAGALSLAHDGTEIYVFEVVATDNVVGIYQYTMSTPWDLATASYTASYSYTSPGTLRGTGIYTSAGVWFDTDAYLDSLFLGTIGSTYTLTLPVTVNGTPLPTFARGKKTALEFVTTDGGTSYELIAQNEVTK